MKQCRDFQRLPRPTHNIPFCALQHFMWVRSSVTNIVGETSNQIGPLPVAEKPLAGRTALVVGVANKDSIASGIAALCAGSVPTLQ